MKPSKPSSAVVVVLAVAGIGNALMAVPMVRQLKRGRPDHRVVVLAGNEPIAEVFRRQPGVDEVVVCAGGRTRLVRESRHRRPAMFVVPFPSNRWEYNVLQWASGAAKRVMHAYPVGRLRALSLLPATRVLAEKGMHDVRQNLRLLSAIGVVPDFADRPDFPLTQADRDAAGGLLRSADVPGQFVVMHAGSGRTILAKAKRWPAERYAMLCQAIHRGLKLPVLIVEGPDEPGVARQIADAIPAGKADTRTLRLACPLGVSGAVLSLARAYVGTDSGLAHLAAAVGTPPVTLFAPADPDRVCPYGHRGLVVQPQTMCTPCFLYPWQACKPAMRCSPPYCIEQINVEQVMAKLRVAVHAGAVEPRA